MIPDLIIPDHRRRRGMAPSSETLRKRTMTIGDADARPQVAKVFEPFLDCGRAGLRFQRADLVDLRLHDAHM